MSKEMWDQRYADAEYVYGTSPNVFFKRMLDTLPAGKILLPAEGEGRNAVYAAECGWNVTAFDQSEEGRKKALRLAAERHVEIGYDLVSLEEAEFSENEFDAVGLVFVHSPASMRQALHHRLLRFLKPGGTLLLTGFAKEQIACQSGGPKDASMLFSSDELLVDFQDLEIISIEKLDTTITEGEFHKGRAMIIELEARKI
jgi:2-polyprenyl-3-methyl-5-hydroxy-6-metoxy-1,4-benzoquinol methylase